jgi:chitinase
MNYSVLSQLSRLASRLARGFQLSVCSLLLLLLAQNAFAGPVTFAWNAVSAANLAGYVLYYGYAPRSYSLSVDVGNYTTAALSGLDQGKTYYFAATAYDTYGQESVFSNEVSYTVPLADAEKPSVTITSPASGALIAKKSTVTITATASDNVGVTRVEFSVNGQLTCSDVTGAYTCDWKVPAAPGRTYQLQAKAYDAQGNVGSSAILTVKSQ